MAIKPICDICGDELMDYGANMYSPPTREGILIKEHICKKCWGVFVLFFSSSKRKQHLQALYEIMKQEP